MRALSESIALLAVCILVGACSPLPVSEPPIAINEGAHSGGSVVAFDPAGRLLASGGWEGRLRLWRIPDGAALRGWPAHADSVNGIAFVAAGRQLVTAGYDGTIARWGIDGRQLDRVDTSAPVTAMAILESADQLLTGHSDGGVRLWRLSDFSSLDTRALHRGQVRAIAIGPHGRRFASAGVDGAVWLWATGDTGQRLPAPPTDAWTLAFSPDAQWLTGGGWFRLYRWRLEDRSLRTLATRHRGIIRAIEYLPGNAGLASISRQTDSAVYVLDPATGATLRRLQQHDLCGADVTVSPDGRYLATTSDDASVRIWDLHGEVKGER